MSTASNECVCCNKGTGGHYGQTGKETITQNIIVYRRCTAGEDWVSQETEEQQWICDEGEVYRCVFAPDAGTSEFVTTLQKNETKNINGVNYTCANPEWKLDTDADKDPDETDCNTTNPNINNNALEICDNTIDDDCDGNIDYDDVECVCPSCSDCGSGLFNLCDRVECNGCGTSCYYQTGIIIGGDCYECNASVKCDDYTDDQMTCNNDPCILENCYWDGKCCPELNGDTLVSCGGTWPDYCESGKEWVSSDMKLICDNSNITACENISLCQEKVIANESYFCDGTSWVNSSECSLSGDCNNSIYWLSNSSACCLSGSDCAATCDNCTGTVDPDYNTALCEQFTLGIQGNCTSSLSGCWNPDGDPGYQCCGDDGLNDTWTDPAGMWCYEGMFYTDADELDYLCELVEGGVQGNCEHGEIGCWDPITNRCCGDDTNELWNYSTNENIEDVLVNETCYKGAWFNREMGDVIFYDLEIYES
tara:strand:- start:2577 stop:4013 length:1437 start_codon:yes stop_codon:yes gene_type:complete